MRNLFLAGAAALALTCGATSLSAQSTMTTTMTTDQQVMYNGWAADQRISFDAWPADYKTYFWTLTPNQMTGWMRLTDAQRTTIYAMTPPQRTAAWSSLEAQMAGVPLANTTTVAVQANPPSAEMPTAAPPNPGTAASTVAPAMPSDPAYSGGPYKGALTSAPGDAMNKAYPICTSKGQDSCQNPGEGGAAGRSRATNHSRHHRS